MGNGTPDELVLLRNEWGESAPRRISLAGVQVVYGSKWCGCSASTNSGRTDSCKVSAPDDYQYWPGNVTGEALA